MVRIALAFGVLLFGCASLVWSVRLIRNPRSDYVEWLGDWYEANQYRPDIRVLTSVRGGFDRERFVKKARISIAIGALVVGIAFATAGVATLLLPPP